jgi:hypothetical protein
MDEEMIRRFDALDARLNEIAELVQQALETIERTEERMGQTSAEFIRLGNLSGRPVNLEREADGSCVLWVGHIGLDIGNEQYIHLRELAFGEVTRLLDVLKTAR